MKLSDVPKDEIDKMYDTFKKDAADWHCAAMDVEKSKYYDDWAEKTDDENMKRFFDLVAEKMEGVEDLEFESYSEDDGKGDTRYVLEIIVPGGRIFWINGVLHR